MHFFPPLGDGQLAILPAMGIQISRLNAPLTIWESQLYILPWGKKSAVPCVCWPASSEAVRSPLSVLGAPAHCVCVSGRTTSQCLPWFTLWHPAWRPAWRPAWHRVLALAAPPRPPSRPAPTRSAPPAPLSSLSQVSEKLAPPPRRLCTHCGFWGVTKKGAFRTHRGKLVLT